MLKSKVSKKVKKTESSDSVEAEAETSDEIDPDETNYWTDLERHNNNPWNRFLLELQCLRNYYVGEAILKKNTTINKDFIDLK